MMNASGSCGLATGAAVLALASLVAAGESAQDDNLVWSDEFDGASLDLTKWIYRGLGPRRGAVNVKEAVTLDGQGHLVLTTSQVGDKIHTGMIATQGKFERAYGYFECRVKLHRQPGHWSAFWLQSPKLGSVVGDTKASGTEIDIFEFLPLLPDKIQHTLHWDGYGKDHKSAGHVSHNPGVGEGWHTFSLLWTPDEYVFYVDGRETWRTQAGGACQVPLYIKLSDEAAFGGWAGDVRRADLPDDFLVDYVRVYDLVDAATGQPVRRPKPIE
jgi:beta-glucanase (GH16 family)